MNTLVRQARADGPPITVLMSVYNGSRWVDDAIKSVLNQSFTDFEFIIVDDGSTDNSSEIIDRYVANDDRLLLIKKENTGLTHSLNIGLQGSHGKWIARIDADDICEPNRLEEQYQYALKHDHLVFIGSALNIIDENGKILKTNYYPDEGKRLLINLYSARAFPAHSSAFFRADIANKIGGYRTRIKRAQDCDLWLRLSVHGKLGVVNVPLVRIRKHSSQISHDDFGIRQKVDSRVAIVSYWLRHFGYQDPVLADNDEDFLRFRAWIAHQLKSDGYFELIKFVDSIQQTRLSQSNYFFKIKSLLNMFYRTPLITFRYLKFLILGDRAPKIYAQRWATNFNDCQNISVTKTCDTRTTQKKVD